MLGSSRGHTAPISPLQGTLVTSDWLAAAISATLFLVLVFSLLKYNSHILHKGLLWAVHYGDCNS